MATKLREYWYDELAGETVEVTDPAQLDDKSCAFAGGDWEPKGRSHGMALGSRASGDANPRSDA